MRPERGTGRTVTANNRPEVTVGSEWYSRDKRERGTIPATVIAVDDRYVHLKRFSTSRVRRATFHRYWQQERP